MALKCLVAAKKLDAANETVAEQIGRFKKTVEEKGSIEPSVLEAVKAEMESL